jgi:hypothetical protein
MMISYWPVKFIFLRGVRINRLHIFSLPFCYSSTSGGILDKAIEAEEKLHNDFLRLVIFLSCYLSFRYIILCPMCSVLFFFMKQNTSMFEQNHVEGYLALSAKTKTYFSTAVALWDAEFYVKVDDDVHVNLGK